MTQSPRLAIASLLLFFITLGLELSDTKVYEPEIRDLVAEELDAVAAVGDCGARRNRMPLHTQKNTRCQKNTHCPCTPRKIHTVGGASWPCTPRKKYTLSDAAPARTPTHLRHTHWSRRKLTQSARLPIAGHAATGFPCTVFDISGPLRNPKTHLSDAAPASTPITDH